MFPKESKILVVDDMPAMRTMIKTTLLSLGYRFTYECENGQDAYTQLTNNFDVGNPFDLVLSDWNMPTMSGLELLKRVRNNPIFLNLPFILITAENDLKQVKEAIVVGVSDYVVKPFSPATLSTKLVKAWKKHHPNG